MTHTYRRPTGRTFVVLALSLMLAVTAPAMAARADAQPAARPMFELYDLAADPHEMTNLSGRPEMADLEHRMLLDLTEWMVRQRDVVPLPVFQRRNR